MAWDIDSQKLVAKAIATVESSMRYDAINYNDPITVGAFQWYGTRAAGILNRMRTENSVSWVGVASTLTNDLSNHSSTDSYWTRRYLTYTEAISVKPVLLANTVIQNVQAIADFGAYRNVYVNKGGNAESNTDAMLFFMVMYHQSPARSLDVLNAAGVGASISTLRSACLANSVLGQYAPRYNTAYDIIMSHDSTGIDLSDVFGSPGNPTPPPPAATPATDTDVLYIKRSGSNMMLVFKDGHTLFCPQVSTATWKIPGDVTVGGSTIPGAGIPTLNTQFSVAVIYSRQTGNLYVGGSNENEQMFSMATQMVPLLHAAGIDAEIPPNTDINGDSTLSYADNVKWVNDRSAQRVAGGLQPFDMVFSCHSNADGDSCLLWDPDMPETVSFGEALMTQLNTMAFMPFSDVWTYNSTQVSEIASTTPKIRILGEFGRHDTAEYAEWNRTNIASGFLPTKAVEAIVAVVQSKGL